jgi:hypothetical protein
MPLSAYARLLGGEEKGKVLGEVTPLLNLRYFIDLALRSWILLIHPFFSSLCKISDT